MQTSVFQFGTSRFLQAHALAFLHSGEACGPIPAVTVVQSTSDPARRGRLDALCAPDGYPLRIRGLMAGREIDREERVAVVRRGLGYDRDYAALVQIFCQEARWIISNTADRGFDPQPADRLPHPDPAQSYPAKLFHLMKARHEAAVAQPLVVLPTELQPRNGDVLRARVLQIAGEQGANASLQAALHGHIWVNSLVDRIVSAEIRPAGAVAEPYALWVIEDQPGLTLPVAHPAMQVVADLEPFERLKLHILNLGHTVLVDLWHQTGQEQPFIRQAMAGPLQADLRDIMTREVIPGFAARGMADQAQAYLATALERFANPFLDHRLADIAQNHAAKADHRIAAFLTWAGLGVANAPRLSAILARAKAVSP